MSVEKLHRHYLDWDSSLKKKKRDFETKWKQEFHPIGGTLSEFTILRTLGSGSFGKVLLVKRKGRNDDLYAMKLLEKSNVVKTKQVKHTTCEIRVLDAIEFEFTISLQYFFKDNVYLFLVMPFISGGEMFYHLRELRKFEENLSKFYAAQVVLAFEYLHYLGLVYRDLKPENILIDSDGYIKITDFGFCKRIDDQRTYTLCGTPEYLAPEILLSQGYNRSVDWWSLGILIYEMNAGYPPFYGKEPMRIYEKIISGRYQVPQHFSKVLDDLISHILQVDRSKRYGLLRGGSKDIKGHDWFKSLEWEAVLSKSVKALFKPKIKGTNDSSNFEYFEETTLRATSVNEYEQMFSTFIVT